MSFRVVEILLLIGVLIYVLAYARHQKKPGVFLLRFLICAAAAWLVEQSCISFYGFYGYSSAWGLFIFKVPLVIVMVWPTLIHSATLITTQILNTPNRAYPFVVSGIVCSDALLIEPISSNCNLWCWQEPGLFGVPIIGILGWAFFAFFGAFFFAPKLTYHRCQYQWVFRFGASFAGTHLLLIGAWWSVLRWINFSINPKIALTAIWVSSIFLLGLIVADRSIQKVKPNPLLARIPGALFFYTLLFFRTVDNWGAANNWLLVFYAVAFMPPYLALMLKSKPGYP